MNVNTTEGEFNLQQQESDKYKALIKNLMKLGTNDCQNLRLQKLHPAKSIKQNQKLKGWGCRMPWLHLCRGVRHSNECPGYDTK